MKQLFCFLFVFFSLVCSAQKPYGYGAVIHSIYNPETNAYDHYEVPDSVEVVYFDEQDSISIVVMSKVQFNKDPKLRAMKAQMEHDIKTGKVMVVGAPEPYYEEKGIRLSGNVYVTNSSSADFYVRVTDCANAKYHINKVDHERDANGYGNWYFVDSEWQADFTIRYVDGTNFDFTICFK